VEDVTRRDIVKGIIDDKQENVVVLCLDTKYRVVHERIVSIGTSNAAYLPPKDPLREALLSSACAIILVHNHPSGDVEPSHADVSMMKRMKEACDLMSVDLLDFIIVGKEKGDHVNYTSMAQDCRLDSFSEAA